MLKYFLPILFISSTCFGAFVIPTGAVTTSKIASGAVTSAKLNVNATPKAPAHQQFLSGSGTYGLSYYFITSAASANSGATYTNNGQTFTVTNTISGGTQLLMTSTGAPAASGTLTKATGTGDATITFSTFLSPLYIRVQAVGGGGGGAASNGGPGGGLGGNTTFGTTLIVANGGTGGFGGAYTAAPGGNASCGTALGFGISGAYGGSGEGASAANTTGGNGGNSALGGAGSGGASGLPGNPGAVNSGSGGGGGGGYGGTPIITTGNGGAAGGFANCTINNPSATYSWAVGASGTRGLASGSGQNGAIGGLGLIDVMEYFQ